MREKSQKWLYRLYLSHFEKLKNQKIPKIYIFKSIFLRAFMVTNFTKVKNQQIFYITSPKSKMDIFKMSNFKKF